MAKIFQSKFPLIIIYFLIFPFLGLAQEMGDLEDEYAVKEKVTNTIKVKNTESRVKVCIDTSDAPPYILNTNGRLHGTLIDITKTVLTKLKRDVLFYSMPWGQCLKYLETGKMDITPYVFYSAARSNYLNFNKMNITSTEVYSFVVLDKGSEQYDDMTQEYTELKDKKIGIIDSFYYGDKFKNGNFKKIYKFQSEGDLLKYLNEKRIDAAVLSTESYGFYPEKLTENLIVLGESVIIKPIYIGFSKKSKVIKLSKRFGEELAAFKKTPEYSSLFKKYIKKTEIVQEVDLMDDMKKMILEKN